MQTVCGRPRLKIHIYVCQVFTFKAPGSSPSRPLCQPARANVVTECVWSVCTYAHACSFLSGNDGLQGVGTAQQHKQQEVLYSDRTLTSLYHRNPTAARRDLCPGAMNCGPSRPLFIETAAASAAAAPRAYAAADSQALIRLSSVRDSPLPPAIV